MDTLIAQQIVFGADVISWIVFVEVPAFMAMIVCIYRHNRNLHRVVDSNNNHAQKQYLNLNDKLNFYKLEVAQKYASVGYLKDVEQRLTHHLNRIEEKLDKGNRNG